MNDPGLRDRIRELEVPGERDAEQRAWELAKRAFADRKVTPKRPTARRLIVVVAAVLILGLALLSPAGASIRHWVADVVGESNARPALTSLPAPGRLLVDSDQGTWVVESDGSQRLVGTYDQSTWSPHGLYIAATRGPRLTALTPVGDPRWTVTGTESASLPSWQGPDGFRLAYLSGASLRVVNGDGTNDRQVADRVAPVAPAWRPGTQHILAFVEGVGTVRVIDTDSGRLLRSIGFGAVHDVAWSPDGSELAVATGSELAVVHVPHTPALPSVGTRERPNRSGERLAFSPSGDRLAFVGRSSGSSTESDLELGQFGRNGLNEHTILSIPGRLTDPTWSPDGRWLLVGWREADQWLFIDTGNPSKVVAIANIARQFDPGGEGTGAFPRISGWCCAP
jgi:WD40 repeat protein